MNASLVIRQRGSKAQLSTSAGSLRAKRILVVDDSADAVESLGALLSLWGYEIALARDGVAAIDKARHFLPDIVLIDIGLPGMTGYEVARALHRDSYLRKARLFAVTGYVLDVTDPEVVSCRFDGIFVKPIDCDELKKAVG